jgi:hypothetical protein
MTREPDTVPERVLERALGFLTPEAEDEARVLAAVQRQLAAGSSAPPIASRPLAPAAAQGSLAGKLALVAALTGAAGFALGFFVGRESSSVPPASPREIVAPSVTFAQRPLEASEAVAREPSAIGAESAATVVEPASAPVARRPSAARSSAARRAQEQPRSAPSPSLFDLRQTLSVLRDAQRAQREGRAGAALERLTTLDARAPADMLAEERLVTRALALCDLGDVDAARVLARALREQNPSSIYHGRLRQSCASAE